MTNVPREDLQKCIEGGNAYLAFRNRRFSVAEGELLLRTFQEAPSILTLTLENCWFDGDSTPILEALKTRQDIQELRITGCKAWKDEDFKTISNVVGCIPALQKFILRDNELPPETIAQFAADIKTHPNLDYVCFAGSRLTDETAAPLLEAVTANPKINGLDISFNGLTDASLPGILGFIQDRPQLLTLNMKLSKLSQEAYDEVEAAITSDPHPNFLHYEFTKTSNVLFSFKGANDKAAQDLRNRIDKNVMTKIPQEDIWLARELAPALDNIGVWVRRHYKKLTLNYPVIEADQPITLDALFTPDEKGFTPIDNPSTWDAHPNLIEELGARGELTEETLKRETPQGHTLLQHIMGFTPLVRNAVAVLNEYGIQIQQDRLLDDEGTPSPLLEQLKGRRQVSGLFGVDNWEGKPAQHARAAMEVLPPQSPKEHYPNRHTFFAELSRTNRIGGLGR